jgi:HlyD family secretion protein
MLAYNLRGATLPNGGGSVERDPIRREDGPRRVHAIGRIEPSSTVLRVAGPGAADGTRVDRLVVAVGDRVRRGAVLAELKPVPRRRTMVAQREAQLATARARLAQIMAGAKRSEILAQQARLERSRAGLVDARDDLARVEALLKRNASTIEAREDALLRRDDLELEVRQSEATLAGLTEVWAVDVELQRAEIRAAEAAVETARAELDASIVRSPIDGRILTIHARCGERIGDLGILEMGDTDVMHAVAEVYEADVSRLRVENRASIGLISTTRDFAGRVVEVGGMVRRKVVLGNDPVDDTGARVVEVRVQIDPAGSETLRGLSNSRVNVMIDVDGSE